VEDQTGYEFIDKGGLAIVTALGGSRMASKKIIYGDDLVRNELEKKLNCVPKNTN
jgi:hypothetical protein